MSLTCMMASKTRSGKVRKPVKPVRVSFAEASSSSSDNCFSGFRG